MLKLLSSITLLLLIRVSVQAQDLIVTLDGDSINSKITKTKADFIYFTFVKDGEIRQTLLPLTKIKIHRKNFYSTSAILQINGAPPKSFPSAFRIAVNAGPSQLLAKTSPDVPAQNKTYISALKSGYHYGLDASFFLANDLGFGIKLNQFETNNSGVFYNEMSGSFLVEDNISTTFIAPSFTGKLVSPSNNHTIIFGVALGYLNYINNGRNGNAVLKLNGATLGSALDAGYDLKLFKNFAIGAQASIISGVLTSYTVSSGSMSKKVELSENERENLSRLDLSLGARFNF